MNRLWMERLREFPNKFTIHDLYDAYPDEIIDVTREQALVGSHDNIVFQFPFFWFSSPPLLKKWQDEVLTYGWDFGGRLFARRTLHP